MSKNTNLSFLTDFLTADIVNSRVGMNNVSPQATFDVTGTGKFSGILTLGSTVSNGTYTYTLPSATGTLALTSDIPSVSGYVPYTGANQSVDLGNNVLTSRGLNIDSIGGTAGALNLRQATSFSTWSGAPFTSIYATTGNRVVFSFSNDNRSFTLDGSLVSAASPRTFTFPDATGTFALTSQIPTNAVGGTGTLNTIPKFTAGSTIGNSNIFDSGSIIYNTNPAAGTFAWQFGGSTVTGQSYGAQVVAGTNASDIGFKVMNAAASINYLVVRGDGNVGIGTVSPSAGLEIETDGSVKTALRVTSNQAFNASPVTAIMFRYRISSGTTIGGAVINAAKDNATENSQAGNLQFWTNNGSTLAERMRIASTGETTFNGLNLTLNNTNATGSDPLFTIQSLGGGNPRLKFLGQAGVINRGAAGDSLFFGETADTGQYIFRGTGAATFSSSVFAGGSILTSPSGADTIIGAYGGQDCSLILQDANQLWELYVNDDFYINRGSTNVLTALRSNGNVGIGTANPTAKFEIQNSPVNDWGLSVWGNTTTGQSYGGIIRGGTNSSDVAFRVNNAANSLTYFTVQGNGKVGIGTGNPDNSYQGLTISGTDPSLRLKTTSGSGWVWTEYVTSAGVNNFSMGVNQTIPYFGIKAGAGLDNPNFAIVSSGNVLIGTTTDNGARLQLGGFSGAVNQNNGIKLTNNVGTIVGLEVGGSNDSYIGTISASNFAIRTSNTIAMTITSGGNVGIGTTTINSERLTVVQTTGNASALYVYTSGVTTGQSYGLTVVAGTNASDRSFAVFNQAGNTEYLKVRGDGKLYSAPTYGNVVGTPRSVFIDSDGCFGGLSSIRASKTNIQSFDTNWLYNLNPVQFNYRKKNKNEQFTDEFNNELFYGLIAEETELINKELCNYNNEVLVGIEYSKLIPVLVKAIQEQQQQIQELKNKLS